MAVGEKVAPPDSVSVREAEVDPSPLTFLQLEITGRCDLHCVHCYADSGPDGPPDRVGRDRWLALLTEASELGVKLVQFIGGEPTLHPDLPLFITAATDLGLRVELYTNLTHIRSKMWDLFCDRNVRLATSFYSIDAEAHDAITKRRGSQARTLANIRRALQLGLRLRVTVVRIDDDQEVHATAEHLRSLGVSDIGIDRSRAVGRAAHAPVDGDRAQELCGGCALPRLAIDPDGWVYPCVLSRWLPVGNVSKASLAEIATSRKLDDTRNELAHTFERRNAAAKGNG
jgi:MoaA/NifB/PqqE/SkfB family radical SAM enzyme